MFIQGHYRQFGNQWLAEIPLLYTVISSKPGEGKAALIVGLERLAQKLKMDIGLIQDIERDRFFFEVKNINQFLPIILKRTRRAKKLSIGDVAKKLGYSSRNSYAQYEYGKTKLSFAKYFEFIEAMDPKAKLVLSSHGQLTTQC